MHQLFHLRCRLLSVSESVLHSRGGGGFGSACLRSQSTAPLPPPPGAQRVCVEWWLHPPRTLTTQSRYSRVLRLLMQNFFEMMFICWIDSKIHFFKKTRRTDVAEFWGCYHLKKQPRSETVWVAQLFGVCRVLANNLNDLNFENKQRELEKSGRWKPLGSSSLFPQSNKAGLGYE